MPPGSKENHLAITVLGRNRTGLLDQLARTVRDCGCSLGDSRMVVLGSEFAMVMMVSGNWNAVAKLEQALTRLEQRLELALQHRRTEARRAADDRIPYAVEVMGLDRPGIVQDIADFFARREIDVDDLYSASYPAPQTGAPLYSLHLTVGIPASASLATVRGEFMDFCDDLNLDAMLAPVK